MDALLLRLPEDALEILASILDGRDVLEIAFFVASPALLQRLIKCTTRLTFKLAPGTFDRPVAAHLIRQFVRLRHLSIEDKNDESYFSYDFLTTLPQGLSSLELIFTGSTDIWALPTSKMIDVAKPKWRPDKPYEPTLLKLKSLLPKLTHLRLSGGLVRAWSGPSLGANASFRVKFLRNLPRSLTSLHLDPIFYGELHALDRLELHELVLDRDFKSKYTCLALSNTHLASPPTPGPGESYFPSVLTHLTRLELNTRVKTMLLLSSLPRGLLHLIVRRSHREVLGDVNPASVIFPAALQTLVLKGTALAWDLVPRLPRSLTHLEALLQDISSKKRPLFVPPNSEWNGETMDHDYWPPNLTRLASSATLPESFSGVTFSLPSTIQSLKEHSSDSNRPSYSFLTERPSLTSLRLSGMTVDKAFLKALKRLSNLTSLKVYQLNASVELLGKYLPKSLTSIALDRITEEEMGALVESLPRLQTLTPKSFVLNGDSCDGDTLDLPHSAFLGVKRCYGRLLPETKKWYMRGLENFDEERLVKISTPFPLLVFFWFQAGTLGSKFPWKDIVEQVKPIRSITMREGNWIRFPYGKEERSKIFAQLEAFHGASPLAFLSSDNLRLTLPDSLRTLVLDQGLSSIGQLGKPQDAKITTLIVPDWSFPRLDPFILPQCITHLNIGNAPPSELEILPLTHLTLSQFSHWDETAKLPRSITQLHLDHPATFLCELSPKTFEGLPDNLEALTVPYFPEYAWNKTSISRLVRNLKTSAIAPQPAHLKGLLQSLDLVFDTNDASIWIGILHGCFGTPGARIESNRPGVRKMPLLLLDDRNIKPISQKLQNVVLENPFVTVSCLAHLPKSVTSLVFGMEDCSPVPVPKKAMALFSPKLLCLTLRSNMPIPLNQVELLPATLEHLELWPVQENPPARIGWPARLTTLIIRASTGIHLTTLVNLPNGLKRLELLSRGSNVIAGSPNGVGAALLRCLSTLPASLEVLIVPKLLKILPQLRDEIDKLNLQWVDVGGPDQ